MDTNVKEKVLEFFKSKGEVPGRTENEQLAYNYLDANFIHSIEIVEMIVVFEEEFHIHFKPQHMLSSDFCSIGGLVALITQLIGEKTRA
jgi:acyl carrier protein|tara:strand:+ start:190 stop:456 length:267 start_codon:yes stop_codon:yes gene_type:complete